MVLSVGKRFLETQSLMRAVKDSKLFFQSQEESWETFDKKIMQYKCFVTSVRFFSEKMVLSVGKHLTCTLANKNELFF